MNYAARLKETNYIESLTTKGEKKVKFPPQRMGIFLKTERGALPPETNLTWNPIS